ncbi:hypothetical protein SODG_002426 [Sodalis praecaptivus]
MIATALLVGRHNNGLIAGYMALMAVISGLCALRLREEKIPPSQV